MGERWLTDLADLVERAEADGIPVFVGEHDVIEALTGFHLHRGALAAMQRPELPTVADCSPAPAGCWCSRTSSTTPTSGPSSAAPRRSASTPCWSPRAAPTRSTAGRSGSRWAPCSRCRGPGSTRGPTASPQLRALGFTVAALALADDAVSLDELAADPPERLALVLGTEGDGLSRRTIAAADLTVRIPMAGGVDSLNVAAAGAVAAWALRVRD